MPNESDYEVIPLTAEELARRDRRTRLLVESYERDGFYEMARFVEYAGRAVRHLTVSKQRAAPSE